MSPPLRIGVTGTRKGLTSVQRDRIHNMLAAWRTAGAIELHHGDCVGADDEIAQIAKSLGYKIVAHPPLNPKLRARCKVNDVVMEEQDYLTRNRSIVDMTDAMVGAPGEMTRKPRSGTWYTISYAGEKQRPLAVVGPSGEVEFQSGKKA